MGNTWNISLINSELPSYDLVIPALLNHGISKLRDTCKLTPGVPLKPMLAKPTKAIGEVLDRFESKHFTCEYKYDGERAQVHKLEDGTIGVFSRNSEDMSKKYPDLMEQLPHVSIDYLMPVTAPELPPSSASNRTQSRLCSMQKLLPSKKRQESSCRFRSSANANARTSKLKISKSVFLCSPLIFCT